MYHTAHASLGPLNFSNPQMLTCHPLQQDFNQCDHFTLYAGALGDNVVEQYVLFLVLLKLWADMSKQCRLVLTCMREHGLDMDCVAVVAAEQTIERAFEVGLLGLS